MSDLRGGSWLCSGYVTSPGREESKRRAGDGANTGSGTGIRDRASITPSRRYNYAGLIRHNGRSRGGNGECWGGCASDRNSCVCSNI